MRETTHTIFRAHCLVTGYGRVAKAMIRLLLACGADVYVAARKQSDLAWITMDGAKPVPMHQLSHAAAQADIIFNTVPARLFDDNVLTSIRKDSLLIDLASKPGGVDLDAAKRLGIRVVWALSLPGKVAPFTAAEIIKNTIFHMMEEIKKP